MKKYFKLFLALVLALVTTTTLTSCFSKTMTPEGMLNEFEKYENKVTEEDFWKALKSKRDPFDDKCKDKIIVRDVVEWMIWDYIASENQLTKGDFRDTVYTKAKVEIDQQNEVTLYDEKRVLTEKMNVKGFSGKAREELNFKGGRFIKNNTIYWFDSINNIKAEVKNSEEYSLFNHGYFYELSCEYYVDNNGSLITVIGYDDSHNISAMKQWAFSDEKVIEIYYHCSEEKEPFYINSIGAYFYSPFSDLSIITTTYKDGKLTAPNIDSYELGYVKKPNYWR